MKLVVSLAVALSLSAITMTAQTPPAPAFDVVSVKRNVSGGPMRMRNTPGNFNAQNVPVRELVRMAYQLQDFQIIGLPDWANTEQFDVDGKFDPAAAAPAPGPPPAVPAMLARVQTLLRDRFGMVARMETRDMPILALKVARSDGRLGPRLTSSTVDCGAINAARGRGPIEGRGGPPPDGRGGPPPQGRSGPPPEGPFAGGPPPVCGGRGGFGELLINGLPIAQFVTQLAQLMNTVVVDRTGLTGGYDIELKWSPTPDQLPPGPPPPGVELPPIDPNGPTLPTALQEQLGLKLDNERGPVQVLVVERLQRPAEN
jgi:uncharacterized protein (TIGR03435 family)